MKKAQGPKDYRGRPIRNRDPYNRFIPQGHLGEIRWETAVANSRARREGKTPKPANIIMFSCRCNCFHINVG